MNIYDLDYLETIDDPSSAIGGTTFISVDGYLDNLLPTLFSVSSNNTTTESSFSTSSDFGNANNAQVTVSTQGEGKAVGLASSGDLFVSLFS